MRVAVVVVNYHAGAVLADCLLRLLACPELAELALVDNGSEPGEIDALLSRLADPRVRRLDQPDNPGFAIACNRGARMVHAPWIAFVNPDCLVEPDTFTRLLAQAGDERLGVIGAQLVDADGRPEPASARRDPLPRRALVSALGMERFGLEGVHLPMAEASAIDCDAVSGALMLVRRAAFVAAGGFDEGYFMHAEDLDLCRRVRELGFSVRCERGVRVVHLKGVSSRRRPYRVMLAKHRGTLRYFDKFDAPRLAWPWRALIRIGALLRLGTQLALGAVGARR
jgi:N-acetylglucosaminyl-diphospho-decaprenol L-rhamnosyltransferase